MKDILNWKICLWLWVAANCLPLSVYAQMVDRICRSDYEIMPEEQGKLFLELDNVCFFKNNEFNRPVVKGYTLPGLWVQPKLTAAPLKNVKLEVGAHVLVYEGAYRYPSLAYQDIATWKGNQFQRGAHVLPYFRAQLKLRNLNLVWGDLYGGSNHGLVAPLYNPELNLTADPEAGFQLICDRPHLHLDAWVNWQSFIFNLDTHQEAFIVGLSTQIKFNDERSKVHAYMPLQMTAQHRGGELDTLVSNSVQTLMNGCIGAGVSWNLNRRILKQVNVEADLLGYYQQAGQLWQPGNGIGLYAKAAATLRDDFRVEGGYFYGKDFISLMGIPFFGTASGDEDGAVFHVMRTWYASAEYSKQFKKHYAIGAKFDLYYACPGSLTRWSGERVAVNNSFNFSFGAYFRADLKFLLSKISL